MHSLFMTLGKRPPAPKLHQPEAEVGDTINRVFLLSSMANDPCNDLTLLRPPKNGLCPVGHHQQRTTQCSSLIMALTFFE